MKVGFVAIVGRPNVGKSSLLNALLNFQVAVVTATPQTTRNKIRGIYNDKEAQVVFVDTPGIHKPKQKLGYAINKKSLNTLEDVDLILFLQPGNESIGKGDRRILASLGKKTFWVVVTKTDKVSIETLRQKVQDLQELGVQNVYSCSVFNPKTIRFLLNEIKKSLKSGKPFYDPEQVTDVSTSFLVKEIIREFVIKQTKAEIPYSVGVLIDEFLEYPKGKTTVNATIYVERESQKGIIIGKDGNLIKKIGVSARAKIEQLLGIHLNLYLRVKVLKNWTSNPKLIKKMGY